MGACGYRGGRAGRASKATTALLLPNPASKRSVGVTAAVCDPLRGVIVLSCVRATPALESRRPACRVDRLLPSSPQSPLGCAAPVSSLTSLWWALLYAKIAANGERRWFHCSSGHCGQREREP